MRVFGCLCYPNLSATTPHKLAPRSSACVYLGPSPDHRGYRCLDLITQRVIISRHVKFDEAHFPFSDFHDTVPASEYAFLDDDPPILFPTATPPATSPPATVPPVAASPSPVAASPSSVAAPPAGVAPPAGASGATSGAPSSPPTQPSGISFSEQCAPASSPPAPSTTSHPMITRSCTGSLRPKQIFNLATTSDHSPIPKSTPQAMCDPNWKAAMDSEMSAL